MKRSGLALRNVSQETRFISWTQCAVWVFVLILLCSHHSFLSSWSPFVVLLNLTENQSENRTTQKKRKRKEQSSANKRQKEHNPNHSCIQSTGARVIHKLCIVNTTSKKGNSSNSVKTQTWETECSFNCFCFHVILSFRGLLPPRDQPPPSLFPPPFKWTKE